jgi:hypothetical protein
LLGTHHSKPKGASVTYWIGGDEIAIISHGATKNLCGASTPLSGVTADAAAKNKSSTSRTKISANIDAQCNRISALTHTKTPSLTPAKFSPHALKSMTCTNLTMSHFGVVRFFRLKSSRTMAYEAKAR